MLRRWEHFRAGSFELPSDGVGISCPASEPARPSPHRTSKAHGKNVQAAYAKEVGMGNPAEET